MFKNIVSTTIFTIFMVATLHGTTYASGFSLKSNSAELLGRANSGSTVSNDILTMYNNPASLNNTLSCCHPNEFAANITAIVPYAKYKDFDAGIKTQQAALRKLSGSFGLATKIHPDITVGLAVTNPYHSYTDYGKDSYVQNHSIKFYLNTFSVSPSIAYKLNNIWSIGAGVDIQHTDVRVSVKPVSSFPTLFGDTKQSGWHYAATFGTVVKPNSDIKLGLAFKTLSSVKLKGYFDVENPALTLQSGDAMIRFKLPASLNFSGSYIVSDKWTIYADYIRTLWSSLKHFRATVPGGAGDLFGGWKDSDFFSLGADYQYNTNLTLRTGLGLDNTPSRSYTNGVIGVDSFPTSRRIPGVPDGNRIIASLGSTYNMQNCKLTAGYSHEFFKPTYLVKPGAIGARTELNGKLFLHNNLFSLQLNYPF